MENLKYALLAFLLGIMLSVSFDGSSEEPANTPAQAEITTKTNGYGSDENLCPCHHDTTRLCP